MDKLTRLSRLQRLVGEAGGQIDGRKKLHKLVYLAERADLDLGQAFQFHMYGVYSPSLSQDLKAAEGWNLLVEDNPSNSASYLIRLGEEKAEHGTLEPREEEALALVKVLAQEPAVVLEVLSTIVYLWDAGYEGENLIRTLKELKGHLSRYFEKSNELAAKYFGIGVAVGAH